MKRLEALEAERLRVDRLNHAEQALAHVPEPQQPAVPLDPLEPKLQGAPGAPPSAPDEPSPEQLLNGQQARDLLERAVKAGKWDDSDRAQFRGQFKSLTGQQQAELLRELNLAMNQGKLQFDPAALPI